VKVQKNPPVKVSKEKSQRNPKEEGHDQGHEMREGEGDTDQEITDTEGGDIPQVLHLAVQIQTLCTDHTSKGRRAKLRD